MQIPKQYLPVMPYLILHKTRDFMQFMKTVFGATEQLIVPKDENSIQHGELKINDAVIMFAETSDQWKTKSAGMFIYVENADETLVKALQNNATQLMPAMDMEYGRSAGFEDPFGNHWWVTAAPNA